MRAAIVLAATGAALLSACGQQDGGAETNTGTANNAAAAAPADMSVLTQDVNDAMPVDEATANSAIAQPQAPAREEPGGAVSTRDAAPAREKAAAGETAPSRNQAAPREPAAQRNQAAARPAPKEEPAPASKPACTPEHREMGHC